MASKKEKQVVLIAGASGGIGTVTADLLLSKGYVVYGTTRNFDSAPKTRYHNLQLDVTIDESVKACVQDVLNQEGKIDILINCAGYALCGALKDQTIDMMRDNFETNFFGAHRMVREVLPSMLERGEGRIINVGSFAGRFGVPFQGAYSIVKSALDIYTEALKIEMLRDNIKVSLIEPGDTQTDFNAGRKFTEGYENDLDAQRAVNIMREAEQKGTTPKKVARTILKAVKAKRPKPRYTRGSDTVFFGTLQRLIPYTIQALFARIHYSVPKKRKD
ncbi:MAG: SDR family oxidoreductase [Candidatus Heimdallarchaeota archaeon]|nr:SDR family oxidoreductase [Candidatus Heimdallarchaeota archaeon]